MADRPILFSAPMVRALLEGHKTQTRRIVRPQPYFDPMREHWQWDGAHGHASWSGDRPQAAALLGLREHCPYGRPGDRLWCITLKPVAGFEGRYAAGDDGNIYRVDGTEPRRMRPGTTSKGYWTVTLCRGGSRKTALVHHLVCAAFYGAKPDWAEEVRHLDGDRTNNSPANLDWGTRSQNWSDKRAVGNSIHGKHHAAKLNPELVAEIRASSETQRVLARRLGVSQATINAARRGQTWAKPPPAAPPSLPRWASRITLEVTGVRVERLQDISEEDARAEGVEQIEVDGAGVWRDYELGGTWCNSARGSFATLWRSIHGPDSWAANPWVWVIEFRRLEAVAADRETALGGQ